MELSFIKKYIPHYIQMICDDFDNNKEYANIFGKLFLGGYSIKKLIAEDKTITNFENWDLAEKAAKYNGLNNPMNEIDLIGFSPKYLQEVDVNDLYRFFDKKEFIELADAQNSCNGYLYYVYEKQIEKKIDAVFLNGLGNYHKIRNQYRRKINDNFSICFEYRKKQHPFLSIEQYLLPDLILEFDQSKYLLFRQTDLSTFLFMPSNSFMTFYFNSHSLTILNSGHVSSALKFDEPVIYESEVHNKFILTNSYGSLPKYNKFIYLYIELSIHYFKVFEKWVIKYVLPELTATGSNTDKTQ